MKPRTNAKKHVLFWCAHASIAVGLFGAWQARENLVDTNSPIHWDEVPATILNTTLVHRTELSEDPSVPGNDSAEDYIQAAYRYEFQGQQFTGSRISLHSLQGSTDTRNSQMQQILIDARESGGTLACRVNPKNPHESSLLWVRHPANNLYPNLCAFLFICIGAALASVALYKPANHKGDLILAQRKHTHVHMAAATLAATAYTALILAIELSIIGSEYFPPSSFWYATIPACLLVLTRYTYKHYRRFGVSTLKLHPNPAVPGHSLTTTVSVPRKIDREVLATLRIVHEFEPNGPNKRLRRQCIWKESHSAVFRSTQHGQSAISTKFALPIDLPTSSESPSVSPKYEIKLLSTTPGINYEATFDVPVLDSADFPNPNLPNTFFHSPPISGAKPW
ncbi:MAG: DUF3592 domain-containing protein [Polyangiaceae bacterium]|nr:DUF3592 domain-containing protein [Polyangiaceae bacterium]